MSYLTTIHTGYGLKGLPGSLHTLSSNYMRWLVVAMAVSLLLTILLGVIMAFKFGHKRTATYCLLGGIITPVILVLIVLYK